MIKISDKMLKNNFIVLENGRDPARIEWSGWMSVYQ